MCLLILLGGVDPNYPILVASNRDERRDRKASPPGLWVGQKSRVLSPRDRMGGGTWLGINEHGLFAGITNVHGAATRELSTTRGLLPHLALEERDVEGAVAAVRREVADRDYNAFQLLVSDGRETSVLLWADGLHESRSDASVTIISNEHRLGELSVPGVEAGLGQGLAVNDRLELLRPLLLDEGASSGHRILKRGGLYGTVSSSLLAVPRDRARHPLVWRFAAGQPDEVDYRNYGNLVRRLDQ